MSLRARLLLSLGALLVLALVVSGAVVVGVTRANLIGQVDRELRSADLRDFDPRAHGRFDAATGRRVGLVVVDPNGHVVPDVSVASGYATSPDPLPDVPKGGPDAYSAMYGKIADGASTDGSVHYRLLPIPFPQGYTIVLTAPLTAAEESTAALIRSLLLVGGAVLLLTLLAGWIIIRRDLRPLERIARTADAIAEGDLDRRSEVAHDRSEVGRLGSAFDAMLDRIQAAFDAQRAALDAKARSEDRLRRFVADASHELRTPITALRGYADLYRAGGLAEGAAMEQAMRRIGTESKRMGALVEDLLLLARLDEGRPIRQDRVDLSTLASDAVADARAIQPDRPIAADLRDGLLVRGDEDRLRQVVGNLFTNVRVHTPSSAPVEVRLGAENGHAVLDVIDHGPGIPPEHAERVFDRFYRADPGRSRDRGGSGLGLAIAASVVEAHGGSVSHRPTPGGGATFTVTLPVASA